MDGNGRVVLAEINVAEALCAQQQLLQQLYEELDAEREASRTATSEALSMILRLQVEKASLKMEADQYKRITEEKICHAEEAFAIFEDIIYQREIEIASLEFLLQAYRYRLLSVGCTDLSLCGNKFVENLLMQQNDASSGEKVDKNCTRRMRRICSLPTPRAGSTKPSTDSVPIVVEASASPEVEDLEKKAGSSSGANLNSCSEHIRKLDERVGSEMLRDGSWFSRLFSPASSNSSIDPSRVTGCNNNSDQVKYHENSEEKLALHDSTSSSTIQDIFEVPSTTEVRQPRILQKKECLQVAIEGEGKLGKMDVFCKDNKDEKDQLKKMFLSAFHEKKLPEPRGAIIAEFNLSPVQQAIDEDYSEAEYLQLSKKVEQQLERARDNSRQETIVGGNQELSLLKEINEQLESLKSEIRSWRTKKSILPDEPSLDPLCEAMQYFWI